MGGLRSWFWFSAFSVGATACSSDSSSDTTSSAETTSTSSCSEAPAAPPPCLTVGAVDCEYGIGEYEVTVSQYVRFLNTADPENLRQLFVLAGVVTLMGRNGRAFTMNYVFRRRVGGDAEDGRPLETPPAVPRGESAR